MKASDPKVALLRSRNTHSFPRIMVASSLTVTIAAGEEIEEFEEERTFRKRTDDGLLVATTSMRKNLKVAVLRSNDRGTTLTFMRI
jgi:hypothetical protein